MKNFVIIDDFYTDPDLVREYALGQQYAERKKTTTWPGRDSVEVQNEINSAMNISHEVGQPLFNHLANKSSYFRITKEGEYGTQNIHFDPNAGLVWAGVLYLTPGPVRMNSGTRFFKHKATGWETSPNMEEAKEVGIHTRDDMVTFFNTEGTDLTKWDQIMNIPFKYNRLALFRPWMWHDGGFSFGKTDEDARQVQLFFFHESPDGEDD